MISVGLSGEWTAFDSSANKNNKTVITTWRLDNGEHSLNFFFYGMAAMATLSTAVKGVMFSSFLWENIQIRMSKWSSWYVVYLKVICGMFTPTGYSGT